MPKGTVARRRMFQALEGRIDVLDARFEKEQNERAS